MEIKKELPELKGTDEQVKAAHQTREMWIEYAEELVKNEPGKVHNMTSSYTGESLDITSEELADMLKEFVETKDQAIFYFKYGDIKDPANVIEMHMTERQND